ncbi:MAG: DUF4912 domain-containing protein [Cyanobacteriota bacterium]
MSAIALRSPREAGPEPVEAATVHPSLTAAPEPVVLTHESAESAVTPASWVALFPQDHQWAVVRWHIQDHDRERALAAGALDLALRLTDVTGSEDGQALPHALQQVVVPDGSDEWHLPVPLGDRDYRAELGWRTSDGGWFSLVFSSVVRMPAEEKSVVLPLFPFTLAEPEAVTASWTTPLSTPGLHERLYQQASVSRVRLGAGSEAFQALGEQGFAGEGAGGQLSGAGLWASGREASGAGLAPRKRSFWLVADAELIVYGATDPAATLSVGDRMVPLEEDGTFHFHATFPDGDQLYPIQALAADGEQRRSITLDFRRTTPHAKVNTREEAVAEWF